MKSPRPCLAFVVDLPQFRVQSDLAYPVLFYPDPSPSGRISLVTDLQHMRHAMHAYSMCVRLSGSPTFAVVPAGVAVIIPAKILAAAAAGNEAGGTQPLNDVCHLVQSLHWSVKLLSTRRSSNAYVANNYPLRLGAAGLVDSRVRPRRRLVV